MPSNTLQKATFSKQSCSSGEVCFKRQCSLDTSSLVYNPTEATEQPLVPSAKKNLPPPLTVSLHREQRRTLPEHGAVRHRGGQMEQISVGVQLVTQKGNVSSPNEGVEMALVLTKLHAWL